MVGTTEIRRLALATTDAAGLIALRAALLAEATRRRHNVVVFCPEVSPAAARGFADVGATVVAVPFAAQGLNPFGPLLVRRELLARLQAAAPHTLAFCGADALATLGPLATKCGVPRTVAMIPSLGRDNGSDRAAPALAGLSTILLETPEAKRVVAAAQRLAPTGTVPDLVVVPSAGIDVTANKAQPLPAVGDGFRFVLVSDPHDRAAHDLFAKAAVDLAARGSAARCIAPDKPGAARDSGAFAAAVRDAHVAVHAGSRDGLAPGLLTALAAGRPIITTDVAASRETIDERVNGCRVPPGDASALATAMASMLKRVDLLAPMARASRLKAERRYDLAAINAITLEALGMGASLAAAAA